MVARGSGSQAGAGKKGREQLAGDPLPHGCDTPLLFEFDLNQLK